jgi:hypothetical protein
MCPYPGETHLMLATPRHNELVAEADNYRLMRRLSDRAGPPRRILLSRWRRLLLPRLN